MVRRQKQSHSRLALESLEDRTVLSVMNQSTQQLLNQLTGPSQSPVQDTRLTGNGGGNHGGGGGGTASGPGYPQPSVTGTAAALFVFQTPSAALAPTTASDVTPLSFLPTLFSPPAATPTINPSVSASGLQVGLGQAQPISTLNAPTTANVLAGNPVSAPGSTIAPLTPTVLGVAGALTLPTATAVQDQAAAPTEARTISTAATTAFAPPAGQALAAEGPMATLQQATFSLAAPQGQGFTAAGQQQVANPTNQPTIANPVGTMQQAQARVLVDVSVATDTPTFAPARLPVVEAPVAGTPIAGTESTISEAQLAEVFTEGVAPGFAVFVNGSSSAQQAETGSDAVWANWGSSMTVARVVSFGLLAGFLFLSTAPAKENKEKRKRSPLTSDLV